MEKEMRIIVHDYETILSCFLSIFYIPTEDRYYNFLINQYQNDLYSFVKFVEEYKNHYWIGYNSIGFDGQVTEYIMRNYEQWDGIGSMKIARMIWEFAQDVIDASKHGLFLPYREEQFISKHIDTPRIWHFFNENKRVSLKQLEFELHAETIENFSVAHDKENFTRKEVEDLISYFHNDIFHTYWHYRITIGDTTLPLYKGKNKILDRAAVEEITGMKCLNYDDVKIGAEWNKIDYIKETGKDEKELRPKDVNQIFGKPFKKFFPSTVEFQTDRIKEFVKKLGDTYVKPHEIVTTRTGKKVEKKQEFHISIGDVDICIAKGGLHSKEKGRWFISDDAHTYIQVDVGSQYPNAIRKYELYPKHLGKKWNDVFVKRISQRLEYKKLWNMTKDPIYASLQEMGKLSLNGGGYGRLKTKGDWQEDHVAYLRVCMGCQLEILMIIEALNLRGFKVVSANTDGFDAYIENDRIEEFILMCREYEKRIGNDVLGNLEYTVFDYIYQTSVNDYLAKKRGMYSVEDGMVKWKEDRIVSPYSMYPDIKFKGDFSVDIELHKNSSNRIVPLALAKYFIEDIEPEEFIGGFTQLGGEPENSGIFEFCARSNAGEHFYHMGMNGNIRINLPKLIRYYCSKEGMKLWKMVKPSCTTGARNQHLAAEAGKKTFCNHLKKETWKEHLENVDRQYYINKAREIIFNVERGKKAKKNKINPNQLNLF